jgi:hypothetical protein
VVLFDAILIIVNCTTVIATIAVAAGQYDGIMWFAAKMWKRVRNIRISPDS